AYIAAGHHFDAVDDRGVHRERPLHPDTEAHLAHGERLAYAATLPADHHALKVLHTGPVAFDDADAHVERVAGSEGRYVVAQRGSIDAIEHVHGEAPGRGSCSGTHRGLGGMSPYCATSGWPT